MKQAQEEISKKDIEIQQLQQTIDDLKDQLLPEHNDIRVLNQQIADLKQSCDLEKNRLTALKDSYFDVENKIHNLRQEYIELDEEILYQSYSLFKPMYDFQLPKSIRTDWMIFALNKRNDP